jgi:hypothetical protein
MDLADVAAGAIVHDLTMLLIDGLAETGAPLKPFKKAVQRIAEGRRGFP